MTIDDLITPEYREEQARLHAQPNGYGGKGRKWAPTVAEIAKVHGCRSVLDYGCGQGSLALALRAAGWSDVREYDPAVPGKDALPAAADLVVCTDVLEHIEPVHMWSVLQHVRALSTKACFVVISLVETAKRLSDGRQAHISLHSRDHWVGVMGAHGFVVASEVPVKPEKQWCAVLVPRGSA
jgi:2-polyprenyl-3-methyl-5-hydroxy-6-metoxy-1,4-benzoquinol methylase